MPETSPGFQCDLHTSERLPLLPKSVHCSTSRTNFYCLSGSYEQVGGSRDGRHGIHAPNATAGSPAGFLAVDLSQSTTVSEGIHAQILRFASRIEPPGWVEVPARRNLLITAIGGRGENGAVGGDGQPGMNGFDGTSATQEVDATVRPFLW